MRSESGILDHSPLSDMLWSHNESDIPLRQACFNLLSCTFKEGSLGEGGAAFVGTVTRCLPPVLVTPLSADSEPPPHSDTFECTISKNRRPLAKKIIFPKHKTTRYRCTPWQILCLRPQLLVAKTLDFESSDPKSEYYTQTTEKMSNCVLVTHHE